MGLDTEPEGIGQRPIDRCLGLERRNPKAFALSRHRRRRRNLAARRAPATATGAAAKKSKAALIVVVVLLAAPKLCEGGCGTQSPRPYSHPRHARRGERLQPALYFRCHQPLRQLFL